MSKLHESVVAAFPAFSRGFEGYVNHPYADVLGLITVGVGNLIDGSQNKADLQPWRAALALPWRKPDGSLADAAQVIAEWQHLKAHAAELAHRSLAVQATFTTIRLTDDAIAALVLSKLAENAAFLTDHHFPFFPQFPADAQLGISSMAWAVGPGFPSKFPGFKRAVLAGDWLAARNDCDIRVGTKGQPDYNPGVLPRNAANRVCFANAEIVRREHIARDILRWPNVAQADVPATETATNLEPLLALALADARIHALEVERLSALREMSDAAEDEVTKVEGQAKA